MTLSLGLYLVHFGTPFGVLRRSTAYCFRTRLFTGIVYDSERHPLQAHRTAWLYTAVPRWSSRVLPRRSSSSSSSSSWSMSPPLDICDRWRCGMIYLAPCPFVLCQLMPVNADNTRNNDRRTISPVVNLVVNVMVHPLWTLAISLSLRSQYCRC